MLAGLYALHLITGPVPIIINAIGAVLFLALLISKRWRRWLPVAAAVMIGGLLLGFLLCWILGDELNLFGVTLSFLSRAWFSVAVAGLALGVVRTVFERRSAVAARRSRTGARRSTRIELRTATTIGTVGAVSLLLVGLLGLNSDLGEFPNLGNALNVGAYHALAVPVVKAKAKAKAKSNSGASADPALTEAMPTSGRIGTVKIPGVVSHFGARPAIVYLPPAALLSHPVALPVIVMLSGQPGGPSDLFIKGHMQTILDDYADTHDGLAPIVVDADQLGSPSANPMCLDSPLGNVETYLTVDVPNWITSHLNVRSGPANWGIGGFSEGGTCAIQLGAAYPRIFGTIVDISGEIAPLRISVKSTIATAFHGSIAAYEAAVPAHIEKAHGPYTNTYALFSIGAGDVRYGAGLRIVERDAVAAGMTSRLFVSPGTAHDWRTVTYALTQSIPLISTHWGLNG